MSKYIAQYFQEGNASLFVVPSIFRSYFQVTFQVFKLLNEHGAILRQAAQELQRTYERENGEKKLYVLMFI